MSLFFKTIETIIKDVDWEDIGADMDIKWKRLDDFFDMDTYPDP